MKLLGRFRREREAMTFEHSMLRTATLCLIAFGAVMVYSASSGTLLLSQGGDSSMYLKRYLLSAGLGLVAMAYFARNGLDSVRRLTPVILAVAVGGLLLVLLPGFGIEANGARRWLGAGPLQIQYDSGRSAGIRARADALHARVAYGNTSRSRRQQCVGQIHNQPVGRRKRLDLRSDSALGRHLDADAAVATYNCDFLQRGACRLAAWSLRPGHQYDRQ